MELLNKFFNTVFRTQIEDLHQRSFAEGNKAGYSDGYKKGREVGYIEGIKASRKEAAIINQHGLTVIK